MTYEERILLQDAVERIPCELSILTYEPARGGSAWLGCRECTRCVVLHALANHRDERCREDLVAVLERPRNGGYKLRDDLR